MNTARDYLLTPARRSSGFSLIELMIVVAIVAILSAVTYPSYVKYVQKSRRADALSTLAQMQVIFERCYAQNFSYLAACAALPSFPATSNQGFYDINLPSVSPTGFTLKATPKTPGVQAADTRCASISINETNLQTASDTSGTAQTECWDP